MCVSVCLKTILIKINMWPYNAENSLWKNAEMDTSLFVGWKANFLIPSCQAFVCGGKDMDMGIAFCLPPLLIENECYMLTFPFYRMKHLLICFKIVIFLINDIYTPFTCKWKIILVL